MKNAAFLSIFFLFCTAFVPFPIFSMDFGGIDEVGNTGILLHFRLTLCGTN